METYEQMRTRHNKEISKLMNYRQYMGDQIRGRQQQEMHSAQDKESLKARHEMESRSFLEEEGKKLKALMTRHGQEAQKFDPDFDSKKHEKEFTQKAEKALSAAEQKSQQTQKNIEETQERMRKKMLEQQHKRGRSR